jgi:hypothetical protein
MCLFHTEIVDGTSTVERATSEWQSPKLSSECAVWQFADDRTRKRKPCDRILERCQDPGRRALNEHPTRTPITPFTGIISSASFSQVPISLAVGNGRACGASVAIRCRDRRGQSCAKVARRADNKWTTLSGCRANTGRPVARSVRCRH